METITKATTTLESQTKNPSIKTNIKVLTVGDGDLTFSLALKRAYYPFLSVTASTLLSSRSELVKTYSNSSETLLELEDKYNELVLFGVDATNLCETVPKAVISAVTSKKRVGNEYDHDHKYEEAVEDFDDIDNQETQGLNNHTLETIRNHQCHYDIILFNHPHLGDALLDESEQDHADRHYSLLCHYFHSAKKFFIHQEQLQPSGNVHSKRIHVCLCGSQPKTWNIYQAAQHNYMSILSESSTSIPVHKWLFPSTLQQKIIPSKVESHFPAPRKYRNGKLGSKHFLGKYGYRHRRTAGDQYRGNDIDMIVEHSVNFIFEFQEKEELNGNGISPPSIHDSEAPRSYSCYICKRLFLSQDELDIHLQSPAVPDIMNPAIANFPESVDQHCNDYHVHNASVTSSTDETHKPISIGGNDTDTKNDPYDHYNNHHNDTKLQSLNPQNSQTISNDIIFKSQVPFHAHNKRLRWYCRQSEFGFTEYLTSKKLCEVAIQAGRILINDSIVTDSSRILHDGDVISLLSNEKKHDHDLFTTSTASVCQLQDVIPNDNNMISIQGVKIIENIPIIRKGKTDENCYNHESEQSHLIIAYKPMGIRSKGMFSSQTLEMIVTHMISSTKHHKDGQITIPYKSLTMLEAGCPGLCALLPNDKNSNNYDDKIHVEYHYTALVHGTTPISWDTTGFFIKMSNISNRRWKRKCNDKTSTIEALENENNDQSEKIESSTEEQSLLEWARVRCIEKLDSSDVTSKYPKISTISITSSYDSGRLSSAICYAMRKLGYPVINDHFCKREYSMLPRIMRNILKNKLCIGCYRMDLKSDLLADDENSNTDINSNSINTFIDPPQRLSCSYWRGILSSGEA